MGTENQKRGWEFLRYCVKGDWFDRENGFLPENDYFSPSCLRCVLDLVDVNNELDLYYISGYINEYIDFVLAYFLRDAWIDLVKSRFANTDNFISEVAYIQQKDSEWRRNFCRFVDDILFNYPASYEDQCLGVE